jgi:hypothetical protein
LRSIGRSAQQLKKHAGKPLDLAGLGSLCGLGATEKQVFAALHKAIAGFAESPGFKYTSASDFFGS